jgi:hypothetical protein
MARYREKDDLTKTERISGDDLLRRRDLLRRGVAFAGALSMGVGLNAIAVAPLTELGPAPMDATKLDVRLLLKTTDGALIVMTYKALRHGPPNVMEKLDKGEAVDPASYYFRMNPLFETGVPKHDWMNRVIAVGTGHRLPDGPIYSIFEVQ